AHQVLAASGRTRVRPPGSSYSRLASTYPRARHRPSSHSGVWVATAFGSAASARRHASRGAGVTTAGVTTLDGLTTSPRAVPRTGPAPALHRSPPPAPRTAPAVAPPTGWRSRPGRAAGARWSAAHRAAA